MSAARPFAGFNPKPSHWGYNWVNEGITTPEPKTPPAMTQVNSASISPEPQMMANQYANMPAALLNTLKRDKKPFTYTPGGVNLDAVLNARLQKRLERKKRYVEEKMASIDDGPKFESPKQLIVMPTYNTPLDMYSMENALEALEVQAELVAADKTLSAPSRSATLPRNHTFRFEEKDIDPGRGVIQSKAFRVLQIITDTEEEASSGKGRPQHQDEMRFTGIRDSKAIPSKFFHTLQKITGTEDDEEEQPPRETKHTAAPRSAVYEKQPTSAGRAPAPQYNPVPHSVSSRGNPKVLSQPLQQQQQQQQQSFGSSNPALKRPAAFLPIKTTPGSGFRPVQAPCLSNGPVRKGGHFSGGTDF